MIRAGHLATPLALACLLIVTTACFLAAPSAPTSTSPAPEPLATTTLPAATAPPALTALPAAPATLVPPTSPTATVRPATRASSTATRRPAAAGASATPTSAPAPDIPASDAKQTLCFACHGVGELPSFPDHSVMQDGRAVCEQCHHQAK